MNVEFKITSPEHIKGAGEFAVDLLHMKKLHIDQVAQNSGKMTVVAEFVPYAVLDDGTKVFEHDTVFKVHIPDVYEYIATGGNPAFNQAFGAIGLASVTMLANQHGVSSTFTAS